MILLLYEKQQVLKNVAVFKSLSGLKYRLPASFEILLVDIRHEGTIKMAPTERPQIVFRCVVGIGLRTIDKDNIAAMNSIRCAIVLQDS